MYVQDVKQLRKIAISDIPFSEFSRFLGLYTNIEKILIFGFYFVLLFRKLPGRNFFYIDVSDSLKKSRAYQLFSLFHCLRTCSRCISIQLQLDYDHTCNNCVILWCGAYQRQALKQVGTCRLTCWNLSKKNSIMNIFYFQKRNFVRIPHYGYF